jgi:hypothetical protein
MKRIIRLTESDLTRIVRRAISEQVQDSQPPLTITWGNKGVIPLSFDGNNWVGTVSLKNDFKKGISRVLEGQRTGKFTVTNNSETQKIFTIFGSGDGKINYDVFCHEQGDYDGNIDKWDLAPKKTNNKNIVCNVTSAKKLQTGFIGIRPYKLYGKDEEKFPLIKINIVMDLNEETK